MFFGFADYSEYSYQLRNVGTVVIPPGIVFSPQELDAIDRLQSHLPEEAITDGDSEDKNIFVRRILIDPVGDVSTGVNFSFAADILNIVSDARRRRILSDVFGTADEYFVRRCQVHRLSVGTRIGMHLDAESNPDNEYAVIVQLGKSFAGGNFVVYPPDGEPQVFAPKFGDVIVTSCKLRHEVTTVTANERISLNLFYSRNSGINSRDPNARCSRPDCKWCGDHLRSRLA